MNLFIFFHHTLNPRIFGTCEAGPEQGAHPELIVRVSLAFTDVINGNHLEETNFPTLNIGRQPVNK